MLNQLMNKLPSGSFGPEGTPIDYNAVKEAIKSILPESDRIEQECDYVIKAIGGETTKIEANIDNGYTPEYRTEAKVLTTLTDNSEFYPFRYLFVRDCYTKLYDLVIGTTESTVVAIIGNPGIGKSTFAKYIMARIMNESKLNGNGGKKVYWALESGSWRYFDGKTLKVGDSENETNVWKSPDVLTLIDGQFKQKHLCKKTNIALFCSPHQRNYAKLVKAHSGAVFAMPSWELSEVEEFIKMPVTGGGLVLSELMTPFYDRMRSLVDQDDFNNDESARKRNQCNSQEVINSALTGAVDNYDEEEAIVNRSKEAFLLEQVIYRFKLVGGRIRLLLHNQLRFSRLKKQVINSVNTLTLEEIKHHESLDFLKHVPSVIYSLNPTDIEKDPSDYDIGFSSKYIADLAAMKMLHEYGNQLNALFAAMKDQAVGGSLVGQLFETLVIQAISTQKLSKLLGRKLQESGEIAINLGNFDIIGYNGNAQARELVNLLQGDRSTFLIPHQSNAAAVDAVYYDANLKKTFFLQMTISRKRGFKLVYLQKLAAAFGLDVNTVSMVFVVPESIYSDFKEQDARTLNNDPYRKSYPEFKQSVVAVSLNCL